MNKEIFKYKLKNKKYDECNEILRNEITNYLVDLIRNKDKYFYYTTIEDLYNKSKEVLSKKEIQIAYELYLFDIMDEDEQYILAELMEMHKSLFKG